ncbi:MAG: 3-phosphoglycerate dehydrogenase, partial [Candidatus Thermoplasmatota archaeon]|nr:3-phosphoglycerate dehydrogenase [Candidatus Thermoplasmatota archaeon]
VDKEFGMSKEELTEKVPPYHGMVVRSSTKVREPTIDAAENLEVIGRPGIGLDNIDLEYAEDKGIAVYNTPTATTISVAELTLTHILASYRDIVAGTNSLRKGEWIKSELASNEIYGKKLGIIGYGNIGQTVGEKADALGMDVIAYDVRDLEETEPAEMVDLDTVLKESDVVTIHVPHMESTHHLISDDEFEKMKENAALVDCSRGGVVDEDALHEALKNEEIRFGSKDVFEEEPPGEHRLFELDNFHATPHIGAQTEEGQIRAGTQAAEKIIDELK